MAGRRSGPDQLADLAGDVALDLHEGISDPRTLGAAPGGCPRWPEHLRLEASNGLLVRGRCRSTNLCGYCAKLGAIENAEALAIDAMTSPPPALWIVLTTRTASVVPAHFYAARRQLHRALRRRWPAAEYAALVEFTTGYGRRSGGQRRPHWNLLLKNVPASAQEAVESVVRRVWCDRVDAEPGAQFVGQVAEVGGLMRYLALHFQKESQSPPIGWRGHRFTHSRGYFGAGVEEARSSAREQLRRKRVLHELDRHEDMDALLPEEVYELAERIHAARSALSWELRQVLDVVTSDERPRLHARRHFRSQGEHARTPTAAPPGGRATARVDTSGSAAAPRRRSD